MSVLFSLKNLNLSFGNKEIFKNANLVIEHGEKVGLIGLNGKGKSSLFKILNGELIPDESQEFIFDKASEKVGVDKQFSSFLVTQKFFVPSDYLSVKDYFWYIDGELRSAKNNYDLALENDDMELQEKAFLEYDRLNFWELSSRFESYLKSFGMEDLDQDVRRLSGGEQRKILIALGLLSSANLILWDEPTNHLDIESIKGLEEELIQSKKTFMIISHDRHLLSKVCNRIVHIKNAGIHSYKGSYADYLESIELEEELRVKTLTKLKNSLRREQDWMNQGIKARGTRSKKRVEGFENLGDKVKELKGAARSRLELSVNATDRKTKKLIEVIQGVVSIKDRTLISGLDTKLFKGDKIGIIGENGVGKSTLMKALCTGDFLEAKKFYMAQGLSVNFFDQKLSDIDMSKTPFNYLGEGEDFIHFNDGRKIHVNAYFQKFLFSKDEVTRPLSSFSGGELKRLQLAFNLKNLADVWIFDEPTNDLDIESIEILEKTLLEFKGTLLIISHDRSFLENTTNKVWFIHDKKCEIFEASYAQASDYIDLIQLEKSLDDNSEVLNEKVRHDINKSEQATPAPTKKKKLSNSEKEKLKKLPALIEKTEIELEEVEGELTSFDYSLGDQKSATRLLELNQRKEELESELLELYELQESL